MLFLRPLIPLLGQSPAKLLSNSPCVSARLLASPVLGDSASLVVMACVDVPYQGTSDPFRLPV